LIVGAMLSLAAASVLLIAIPGPSVLFIIGQALAAGRRAALLTVLGNAVGTLLVGLCVSFGLGSVLGGTTWLRDTVRWVGLVVLVVLGVGYLLAARRTADLDSARSGPRRAGDPFVAGALVGATNPKALIIFGTVVPGFLPATGDPRAALMLLSLTPPLVGLVVDATWALAAGAAGKWLARSGRAVRYLNLVGGLLLLVLAAVMAAVGP
jgi:threonine/homoserine/homoserine lactone efflux protein